MMTTETTKMTWTQLKAAGVKRCCGVFRGGKLCRRRAADQRSGGFCEKCGGAVAVAVKQRNDADK